LTPLSFKKLHQNSLISLLMFRPRVLQGGILMAWNGTVFFGQVIHSSQFAITVAFTALLNSEQWKLIVVYGTCHGQDRQSFSNWLNNLQISTDENWMIVGDFNFYRSMENRIEVGLIFRIS
jgi:hypothetical protein